MKHYTFPTITHLDEVLSVINGKAEFIVAEKEGYTVINYVVAGTDTFPEVKNNDKNSSILRECRGIIFDSKTGKVIRRPYHKFFNVNEKAETQENLIDLSFKHHIPHKLDGSMIGPFRLNDKIVAATKMGVTDVAFPVQSFMECNDKYIDFSQECIGSGVTPIFEWCSRKQRIVLDHPEDKLILTGMRHMVTGNYETYESMLDIGQKFDIPVVDVIDPQTDMRQFIEHVSKLEDVEGFIIRFINGHMIKIKCDWYCTVHRAKESAVFDRHIVTMILDEKLDDIISHFPEDERNRLREFENNITTSIKYHTHRIHTIVRVVKASGITRKEFALTHARDLDKETRPLAFHAWENNNVTEIRQSVMDLTRTYLHSNKDWDGFCSRWFEGVKYNK